MPDSQYTAGAHHPSSGHKQLDSSRTIWTRGPSYSLSSHSKSSWLPRRVGVEFVDAGPPPEHCQSISDPSQNQDNHHDLLFQCKRRLVLHSTTAEPQLSGLPASVTDRSQHQQQESTIPSPQPGSHQYRTPFSTHHQNQEAQQPQHFQQNQGLDPSSKTKDCW